MLVLDPTTATLYASLFPHPTTAEEKTHLPDDEYATVANARRQAVFARRELSRLGIDPTHLLRFDATVEILTMVVEAKQ